MTRERRVVVTGMGLRSPIGNSPGEVMESLHQGKSGIRYMPEWEAIDHLHAKVAGVCAGIDENVIPRMYRRSMGRVAVLAALATTDAIKDSGLGEAAVSSDACGVSYGSTEGSTQAIEDFMREIIGKQSLRGMKSSTYLQFMSHTCAANLAIMFRVKGTVVASCTACVSGSQGVGFGYEAIKAGRADMMLAGGSEEMHFMDGVIFDLMRATSTKYNDHPESTPRPFDADRDGLVVGEGAGTLVLEEYEHARRRQARIYCEVLGFGNACDGEHLTNPSPEGMARAITRALADAKLPAEKIEYVNAHATATQAGDLAESRATNKVLGPGVPVSGLKGYMGHTLGGCGAIESIMTIIMMRENFIAPTRNLFKPDPELAPLNHVMGDSRDCRFSIAMNNNFAFGGINTSLIFGKI
ncbi:MAG: beta-ketoacyl-ACP synthase [bacterium]|nr:beta-ketoacyl-ACP synthase [bacterium]